MESYIFKNKERYKKEISHFLDKNLYYNTLYKCLINNRWEEVDENAFIKVYPQDNLVVKLEIKHKSNTKTGEQTISISDIIFFKIKSNNVENFLKIADRILSDVLCDLNHIFRCSINEK